QVEARGDAVRAVLKVQSISAHRQAVVAQIAGHAAKGDLRAQQARILRNAAQLDDAVSAGRNLLPGDGDGLTGAGDLQFALAVARTHKHGVERLATVAVGLAEGAGKLHLNALGGEPNKGRYAECAGGGTGGSCKGKRGQAPRP